MLTDPNEHAYIFDDLPKDIPSLCQVVQNNLLHIFLGRSIRAHFDSMGLRILTHPAGTLGYC